MREVTRSSFDDVVTNNRGRWAPVKARRFPVIESTRRTDYRRALLELQRLQDEKGRTDGRQP